MLSIIASIFLSGAAHTNAEIPLTPRAYTGEECGVSYLLTERAECGVREYKSCQDKSCDGYQPERTEERYTAIPLCSNPRNCSTQQKAAADRVCTKASLPFRRAGKLLTWHTEGNESIVATCKIPELITSCRLMACGPESFNPCADLSKPQNKTCSILMTRLELSDYIESVRSQIEVNSQLYAVQKATFFIQAKNKQESACLISKWDDLEQYSDVITELKAKFIAMYDETFDAQSYDCSPTAEAPEVLNFRDFRCAAISQTEVLDKLNEQNIEPALRTFYGNCLAQKAYQKQEKWFRFNISETNRLIKDIVASTDGQMAEALVRLKNDMEAKKIGGEL